MARVHVPHKDPHNTKAGVEHRKKKRRSRWHRRKNQRLLDHQVRYGVAYDTYQIVERMRRRRGLPTNA